MAFAHQQPSSISPNEQLRCTHCRVTVPPTERNLHYRSDWHRYNVKRKCVGMPPIEKQLFEAKLKSIISSKDRMDSISNKKKKKALNKRIQNNYDTLINNEQWQTHTHYSHANNHKSLLNYICTLCHKTFKTHQQCLSHLNTKKHKNEFIKYHKNVRSQQRDEINAFHATNDPLQSENSELPSMDTLVPLHKLKLIKTIKNNPFIVIRPKTLKNTHKSADESKEGPKNIRERIPLNNCLFCGEICDNLDVCVSHMQSIHGWFVPLPKRLKNCEKMMECAGDIIGKYLQCVWCWKVFKSLRAVRMHMCDRGHCKFQIEFGPNISYDSDMQKSEKTLKFSVESDSSDNGEDSPFLRHFDFERVIVDSDTECENRELDTVSAKRYVKDINASDELVRNDGTVIGHRGHLVVYKQKHKRLSKYSETQTEEQIIAQINNPLKKYKLLEMERVKNSEAFENSGAKQQVIGGKIQEHEHMNLQTRAHKVKFQNWCNLQKSKQLRG